MSKQNVLILFSDEHRRDALGCYGHPLVKTPNLDALAARGVRFENAYTSSPICVPARASLATGEYVHKTGCWSNAQAYSGIPQGWGHQLQQAGCRVESIGKLHYRGAETNNGFDVEHHPMYIRDGVGWIKGLLRKHESFIDCSGYARHIGPGEDSYTEYDLGVTQAACDWLTDAAGADTEKPWALFVSWLRPHYPLTCPLEFYDLYPLHGMDAASHTVVRDNENPVVAHLRRSFNYDDYFNDEGRQIARASYYGLCSFLDAQIGQVLAALQASGQMENTLVIYTSDHGDHNGDRRLWTKMTMFEESAGIPLIMAGPDIPSDKSCSTLSSLVDLHPTVLNAMGVEDDGDDRPGIDLKAQISASDLGDRAILSEYHDGGSLTGMFMLRWRHWKYNYYPGYPPELYDLSADPGEQNDLGESDRFSEVREACHARLQSIVDTDRINDQAFSEQKDLIKRLGGEQVILASDEFDSTPVEEGETTAGNLAYSE